MFQDFHLGLFDILVAIVIFQYLLIAVFLFNHGNRDDRRSAGNYLLALFFCLVALNLIDGELMMHGFYYAFPNLALLEDSLVLTYGPILYFYTLTVIDPGRKRSFRDLVHFLPALILLAFIVFFYTLRDDESKRSIIYAVVDQRLPVLSGLLSFSIVFVHFFGYLFVSIQNIKTYHLSLHERYASLENVNVSWLVFTLKTLGITFVVSWISTFLAILRMHELSDAGLVAIVAILLYYINTLVVKALKDPRLFSAVDPTATAKKYTRQPLETADINELSAKLDQLMLDHRLYSDADLTLEKLAERVEVPARKLSQFLNDVRQQSFFDYVNGLRIDEAKRLLKGSKDPKLTVQEVMYRVGFNSKSSFNTLFRGKTGQTPSSFKKLGSGS